MILAAYILGLVFAAILFRCSKKRKPLVWIIGCIILNVVFNVHWIIDGVKFVFELSSRNVYLGMISLLILTIIDSVSLKLISRKAQLK